MSVKKERPDTVVYPPPPPLLQQGMRPNVLPMYGSQQPFYLGQMPPGYTIPRPPTLQASPGSTGRPAVATAAQNAPCPPQEPLEQSLNENDLNKRIDKASIKGTFGWETIDDANIPCIFRSGEKFVSVRMVEQKLLSKYPSTYPDELRDRPPLMSQFITLPESRLLNEINIEHCACEYGQRSFTEKDLVVSLKDFISFYKIVKKHFPNEKQTGQKSGTDPPSGASGGGWVQVNNTVVPYLRRFTPTTREVLNLAPLPVIKYAAGLLTDSDVPALEPTDVECKLLSDMCKSAGLDFNFSHNTPLILLQQLPVYCSTKVLIKRLPDDDPFGNAEYCPEFDMEDAKVARPSHGGVMLPTMQDLSPQSYSNQLPTNHGYFAGPPNVTVQPGTSVPFSQLSNTAPTFIHQSRPDAGAQSLQALEKIAGPPRKKQRIGSSPAELKGNTPNGTPRASPNHPPRASPNLPPQLSPNHPVQAAINQGMPPPPGFQVLPGFRPGLLPFVRPGSGLGGMTPPGAASAMWPSPANPADMQKLAEIMNMQAAILSGPMPSPQNPPQPSARQNIKANTGQKSTPPLSAPNRTTAAPVRTPPQNPQNHKAKPSNSSADTDKIQPVDFHGKKISCLVKGPSNDKYALIEAISRVYFPHCPLEEFIKSIVNVLQLHIYQLDREEEKSFISFYGLPTSSLKCNKVLKLADLDKLMPQLKYMFKAKDSASNDNPGQKPPHTASPAPLAMKDPQDTNNNANSSTTSLANPSPGPAFTNATMPPTNPFVASAKRSAGAQSSSSKASKKLEDAVNRLRQNKLMQLETNPAVADPGAVNQVGQGQVPRNPFITDTDI